MKNINAMVAYHMIEKAKELLSESAKADSVQRSVRRTELDGRITNYLGNGGLFNPEHMEHKKVRDLLIDLREYLRCEPSPNEEALRSVPTADVERKGK